MTLHDDDHLSFPAPPAPRRSDDAFARAVAADVDAARKNRLGFNFSLAVPAVAASAFAVVMAVSTSTPTATPTTTPTTPMTAPTTALVIPEDADDDEFDLVEGAVDLAAVLDDADESTLLALADIADSDSDRFTFDALDGSTDQELADVEAALDSALRQL